jgi:ABC-type multidrug transport system fused ATPase/permease subunit
VSATSPSSYNWRYIFNIALRHRRELILANLIAILAATLSVPLPLLMPLLVDEVLLEQPGVVVATVNNLLSESWQGPPLYIGSVLVLTVLLRLLSLGLNVLQARQFTIISKDVIYHIRAGLLERLQRISMAEYETLGSGSVASHFVTDLDTVDRFVGSSVSRFLVAVLSIIGTAVILLWMHWQPALFNGSVRDNLTLGRDISDDALWQALDVAQLKDFVIGLEQGLHTMVGRQGVRLSGGQRQRLAIARMVLTDPAVVILDEATSALDTQTEFALHRAMSEFLSGRTTVIVAHRLSAVRQADKVYVFEDGKVIEQGSHDELLDQQGLYAKLYGQRQL